MRPVQSLDRTRAPRRRRLRARLLVVGVCMLVAAARADALLYDVDFSSPPHTVGQLIDSGHLVAEERRHFRYVTLASLFAYQRRR